MRSIVIVPGPRLGKPLRTLICAVLCTFWAASAAAQLADDSRADRERPTEQYRNGNDWLRVVHRGSASSGRTALVLEGGGHRFHAEITGHAIVQLADAAEISSLLRREQLQLVRPLSTAARLYLVESLVRGAEDGLQIASRLAAADGFVEAIPDLYLPRVRHGIRIPPDDPHYKGQWYLKKIGIEKAWKLSTGDADTKVVVVDDGCDLLHPDLREKFQGGRDVLDQDDDPSYQPGVKNNAHGTACAGLVGAKTDNGEGMAGVCPDCSLLCVRLLPGRDDKAVPVSADIDAFDFSLKQGASVVSNSWGFSETVPAPAPLRALLEMLHDEGRDGLGTLVVFAAGNENRMIQSNEVAAVRGVLTVGAINNFDEAAPFSNYGASLGVTAPAGTFTTDITGPEGMDDGDYSDSFGGTSSACPVVAGVAGLVMSARKDMSAADVLELLQKTTRAAPYAEPDSRGHDKTYGFGIVDPAGALRMALGVKEEPDAGVTKSSKADDSGGCAVTAGRADAVMLLGFLLCLWSLLRRRDA